MMKDINNILEVSISRPLPVKNTIENILDVIKMEQVEEKPWIHFYQDGEFETAIFIGDRIAAKTNKIRMDVTKLLLDGYRLKTVKPYGGFSSIDVYFVGK